MKALDEKYFQTITEIDYLYYQLRNMYQTEQKLPAIMKQIDKATGYDKGKLKVAKSIVRKINYRKKKLELMKGGSNAKGN